MLSMFFRLLDQVLVPVNMKLDFVLVLCVEVTHKSASPGSESEMFGKLGAKKIYFFSARLFSDQTMGIEQSTCHQTSCEQ